MGKLFDVPGFHLGHVTRQDTGCTVIVAPNGAYAGVDVRGGGPGTRETDLLEPHNSVQQVHAVALCGGSAFGLAAADGVMRALEERGIGFPVFGPGTMPIVPIVPAAVIFDLAVGDPQNRPTSDDGYHAVADALDNELASRSGSIGAGTGATAGALRGGFGQAVSTVGEYKVAAVIVANPVGEVIDFATGRLYGAPGRAEVDVEKLQNLLPKSGLNTTIGTIVTDAPLTKAQAKRVALSAHDGLARAVRPAHSPMDGDTLFAMSSGNGEGVEVAVLAKLCAMAADLVQNAIIDAITSAGPGHGLITYRELST